ncbi:general secretion pathway protein G [Tamilnaduibacter salinus]|nr:type II secretion system protein [Tamilnaduibacter salinus]PVY79071.1 general secretion pathway protein G [Tamilnaduibacter salinus]
MGQRIAGFTLLELMVVLLILALGAAVATPAVMRLADKLGERNERDQLALYLQNLPVAVMNRGQGFSLESTQGYIPLRNAAASSPLPLPDLGEGYPRIWVPDDVEYRPNGACTGGVIHWELSGGKRFSHALEAPLCRPRSET